MYPHRYDDTTARTPWHQTRSWTLAALCAGALLVACGGNDDDDIDRGPSTIGLSADPNGVFWDASRRALHITDDNSNAILAWDGDFRTTFSQAVALPALQPPASPTQVSIGELTRTPDGTFYTTRFGFGNAGTVIEVRPAGAARNLTGLDPVRRRIAITRSPAGELIDSWFTTPPSPGPETTNGRIGLLTVNANGAATETELVTGLSKPVGAAVLGRTVYVTDQATGNLLSFPLDAALAGPLTAGQGTVVATFTTNLVSSDPASLTADNIDLMTAAPDGMLYFGGRGGKLYRVVASTGAVTLLTNLNSVADPGRLQVRGVAHDAQNRRLFVLLHSTDVARVGHSLRILPLD